jgi:hypothetical protein
VVEEPLALEVDEPLALVVDAPLVLVVDEPLVLEVDEPLVPEELLDPDEFPHAVDPVGAVGPLGPDPPELGGVDALAAEALANAPTAQPATISFATRTVCSLSQACGVSCRAGAERAAPPTDSP